MVAIRYYLLGILIAIDVLANSLIPGAVHYETISCRIEENIKAGGWASKVPWPAFMLRHFLGADYVTKV